MNSRPSQTAPSYKSHHRCFSMCQPLCSGVCYLIWLTCWGWSNPFPLFFLVLRRSRTGGAEMVSNGGNGVGGGSRSSMVCILTYMVIWPRLLPSSPPPPPPSLLISMATSRTGTLLWSVPSLPPPFLFSFCLRYDIIIIMRYAILPVWWRR